MVFASTVMHLHAHGRFICLDIRAADQLTTDGRGNRREQLTHSHDLSIQRDAADLKAGLPFQNRALTVTNQLVIWIQAGVDTHWRPSAATPVQDSKAAATSSRAAGTSFQPGSHARIGLSILVSICNN